MLSAFGFVGIRLRRSDEHPRLREVPADVAVPTRCIARHAASFVAPPRDVLGSAGIDQRGRDCMTRPAQTMLLLARFVALAASLVVVPPVLVNAAPAQPGDDEEEAALAPLTVGSMALASDPSLQIEGMAIDVTIDHAAYSYRLRNRGQAKLALTASVAMPDLEVNTETNNIYDLPAQTPDNPVKLEVRVNDTPVPTVPSVQAVALGLDRAAEIKAAGLPLIPFGAEAEKAMAAAKPEVLAKLETLGLVTPRDPSQPDTPIIADWSLHVVHGFTLSLDPGATSTVVVGFSPVKATYHVDAPGLAGFNALKDQVCLTPQVMNAARALAKTKGAVVTVTDITLANDGPARWLDNPAATVAVRKPQPASVVAYCGMDAPSTGQPVVTGKMPGSDQASGLRVLVFSPGS